MNTTVGPLVQTQDGSYTLRHAVYDEEFHSLQGARFEAEQLYMFASGFKECIDEPLQQKHLHILDVGLGLGYNALMTIETWWHSRGLCPVTMVSLEQSQDLVRELASQNSAWKAGWSQAWLDWSLLLQKQEQNLWAATVIHPVTGAKFTWSVQVGDATRAELGALKFDYIWQDAFSPKKNAELWSADWFRKLREASSREVCLVTYSVARVVKDNLAAAAWGWERVKAPGHKRQWLKASLSTT